MKLKSVLFSFLIISLTVSAQEYSSVEDVDVLKHQKELLTSHHPHLFRDAEILDVVKLDGGHSLVRYNRAGKYCETIVNSGRKDMLLLETAESIPKDQIPGPVMAQLKDELNGKKRIENQFKVNRPYGDQLYRIDLNDPDSDDIVTLYFDELGHPAKNPM